MAAVEAGAFRDAMSRIPAPVTVVTTYDQQGKPRGFTASAVCSLSLDPPLVLVCVARDGRSHDAFVNASRFMVNLLPADRADLARHFAYSGGDRFATGVSAVTEAELPALSAGLVRLACRTHSLVDGGDHSVLIGLVQEVTSREGDPLVYHRRGFARIDTPVLTHS